MFRGTSFRLTTNGSCTMPLVPVIRRHLNKLQMHYPQLNKEETEILKVYRKQLMEEDKTEK